MACQWNTSESRRGGENSVNSYWYLLTLFQLLVIVGIFNFFIDKIQNTTYQIIAEITMLAITKVLFSLILRSFDISVLHMLNDWYPKLNQMFAYFATGSFLMRHLDISKLLDGRIHSACLLLFCVTTALHKPVAFMAVSLQSVAAIYCSFYMFKVCFTEGKIIDYFKRIGKQTLQIYILHFFFAIKIVQIGNYLTTLVEGGGKQCLTAFVLQLIVSFALSVVIIEMSLLAGKIIKTSNILSRLVLGESASLPHGR